MLRTSLLFFMSSISVATGCIKPTATSATTGLSATQTANFEKNSGDQPTWIAGVQHYLLAYRFKDQRAEAEPGSAQFVSDYYCFYYYAYPRVKDGYTDLLEAEFEKPGSTELKPLYLPKVNGRDDFLFKPSWGFLDSADQFLKAKPVALTKFPVSPESAGARVRLAMQDRSENDGYWKNTFEDARGLIFGLAWLNVVNSVKDEQTGLLGKELTEQFANKAFAERVRRWVFHPATLRRFAFAAAFFGAAWYSKNVLEPAFAGPPTFQQDADQFLLSKQEFAKIASADWHDVTDFRTIRQIRDAIVQIPQSEQFRPHFIVRDKTGRPKLIVDKKQEAEYSCTDRGFVTATPQQLSEGQRFLNSTDDGKLILAQQISPVKYQPASFKIKYEKYAGRTPPASRSRHPDN